MSMQQELYYSSPWDAYGSAIDCVVINSEGEMYATNGEYSTRVNFCPFTGTPAPKQMRILQELIVKREKGDEVYKVYGDDKKQ